jgi:NAD(P)H-hydrate repair Nnr-like enzyme with NAD(P)H-hydrate epimerase domain/8-oxo-dGTP pyrophosphatase MutT (NUDIX family)
VTAAEERLRRLTTHLSDLDAAEVGADADRVGAVLALLGERDDDLEFVLTRRRDDLPTHPGQVSFAGGRREPGESTVDAALREAAEEIALRPDTVEVLGQLPAFFIPPSRFWMVPVVARWREPHPLRAQEDEVAAIVHAPLERLVSPEHWRKVRLSVTGWSWAWALPGEHVLWGATGMVVTVLLDALAPGWRRGIDPADLPDDREVTPWLDQRLERRVLPARLRDVGDLPRAGLVPPGRADLSRIGAAGAGVAAAVRHLRDEPSSVVVLAGPGGTGAVGRAAARDLRGAGLDVTVVTAGGPPVPGMRGGEFAGALPHADLYIDALVGGGQQGQLRGAPLRVALALRSRGAPILAVDVPSGLHPTQGLVGDAVSATVTVAVAGMWPALDHAGLSPFVGDLYLWRPGHAGVVRLVGGPERVGPGEGWRE